MEIKKIGILVGGGPSPGTNGVIAAAAIHAINLGCTPVGFHSGFEWLAQRYTDEQHELTLEEVSRIHLDGGVILGTSRTDITRNSQGLENTISALTKLEINALVTIGGDDLVGSAIAVEQASRGSIRVVLVPKTVDNDLLMPLPVPTLGYETARHVGVGLVKNLMEDARTTGRWYIAVTMGRPTGHLTIGIGKAANATCTVISEEFEGDIITLSDIARIVEGSIIKRRAMGLPYGVALLSGALVEKFNPEVVSELQDVDRDAQGNIRVTEIDLGRKVKNEVQVRLERRDVKVTIVDKTIGYELRCAQPIPYDAEYARDLGYAAINYLCAGGSGAMISIQDGRSQPIPLAGVLDPVTGRGRLRLVDINTESYKVARDYMVRIEARDFRDELWVKKLSQAAGLNSSEFLAQFASLAS